MILSFLKKSKEKYYTLTIEQFNAIYPCLKGFVFHRLENGQRIIKTKSKSAKQILDKL